MRQYLFRVIFGALLGAVIGAAAFFFLAEGMTEGLVGGILIGGSVGALLAARIHAYRASIDLAKRDPEEAQRQARLRDERSELKRAQHRLGDVVETPGLHYLDSKIRDE